MEEDSKISTIKQKIIPILKRNSVSRAGLFGSFAKDKDTDDSDVDILVQLENKISLIDFVKIKLSLEEVLQRKVDLVEYQAIKPRLRNWILSEEVRIYG